MQTMGEAKNGDLIQDEPDIDEVEPGFKLLPEDDLEQQCRESGNSENIRSTFLSLEISDQITDSMDEMVKSA